MLVTSIVLFVVAFVLFGLARGQRATLAFSLAGVLTLALATLAFAASFVVIVPPGHRGVVTWFGKVEDRILPEGLTILVPFAESVTFVDVRVQPHPFREIEAASREYQSVRLTGMMNFRVNSTRVNLLYQQVGLDFADKVIDPAFNDIIKEITPHYSINEVLPKRDEIRRSAKERLQQVLAPYYIEVLDIYISDISFSEEYSRAIEEKQVAQQQVEREQQVLAQRRIQAEQLVAQAKGEAEARVTRAEGEARANTILRASLSPEVIQYLAIQAWDGRVPLVAGAGAPLITIPLPSTPEESRPRSSATPTP